MRKRFRDDGSRSGRPAPSDHKDRDFGLVPDDGAGNASYTAGARLTEVVTIE